VADRHLVSQRRTVPAERLPLYEQRWADLHVAATALGAHAWRFVSSTDPCAYLEVIEFRTDADPRADPAVRNALRLLDARVGASAVEEWGEPK
jgi:hypothetical protein